MKNNSSNQKTSPSRSTSNKLTMRKTKSLSTIKNQRKRQKYCQWKISYIQIDERFKIIYVCKEREKFKKTPKECFFKNVRTANEAEIDQQN